MQCVQGWDEVPFFDSLHLACIVKKLLGHDNNVNDICVLGEFINTGSRLAETSEAVEVMDAIDPIFVDAVH